MTTRVRNGSSRWRRRVKCSDTSKSSWDKSRKKSVATFDAYDRTDELLPLRWRHSERILMPTLSPIKWSRRKKESANNWGSTRHDAWEAHAGPLLNRSGIHSCLSHESVQHRWSTWAYSVRNPLLKEAHPLASQGVQKHRECTHPERRSR